MLLHGKPWSWPSTHCGGLQGPGELEEAGGPLQSRTACGRCRVCVAQVLTHSISPKEREIYLLGSWHGVNPSNCWSLSEWRRSLSCTGPPALTCLTTCPVRPFLQGLFLLTVCRCLNTKQLKCPTSLSVQLLSHLSRWSRAVPRSPTQSLAGRLGCVHRQILVLSHAAAMTKD